jgi:hypothetical protein
MEVTMYQPWIFATVTAAGAGLVALTVTLQRPPIVPERSSSSEPGGVHVLPPPAAAISEPAAQAPVLELEPIVIRAAKQRPRADVTPASVLPASVLAERPCSPWRELGPTHVVSGTPSGDLSVRALCP